MGIYAQTWSGIHTGIWFMQSFDPILHISAHMTKAPYPDNPQSDWSELVQRAVYTQRFAGEGRLDD